MWSRKSEVSTQLLGTWYWMQSTKWSSDVHTPKSRRIACCKPVFRSKLFTECARHNASDLWRLAMMKIESGDLDIQCERSTDQHHQSRSRKKSETNPSTARKHNHNLKLEISPTVDFFFVFFGWKTRFSTSGRSLKINTKPNERVKEKRKKRHKTFQQQLATLTQASRSPLYMQQFWWCHHFSNILTFGKSRMWFASSSSSSRLRE